MAKNENLVNEEVKEVVSELDSIAYQLKRD